MTSIAVIGAGAVGGYYGAMLARAGHDVRFLLRRDLEAVRERGLDVRSYLGDFHLPHVKAAGSPGELGQVDWVVCSLKATALAEARALIEPCVGPETRVLALMNGLGIEERFAEWLEPWRVFGGMAFVGINRGEPGVIHHLAYGRVTIGHLLDDAVEIEGLRALLDSGGIDVAVAPNLRWARWEKLCWNVPFNGLSVACGGVGTHAIIKDTVLRATADRVMREVVAVGNADLAAAGTDARLDEERVVGGMFAQTDAIGDYRTSMALDYVYGRPLEAEAIHGEVARRAESLGVAAPSLATLYAIVRAADARVRGEMAVIGREEAG